CSDIRTILSELEGANVSAAEIWPFLRVLHVLSLDLNSSTGQAETAIKSLLAYTSNDQDPVAAADAPWNALLRLIGEGMPAAPTFRLNDLPDNVRRRHGMIGGPEQRVLRSLADHSAPIIDGIRSTIGRDLHLDRAVLVQAVVEQLGATQVVLVTGPAGSGK